MKKTLLHIMMLSTVSGALLWNTPAVSYADIDSGSSVILTHAKAISSIEVVEEELADEEAEAALESEVTETAEAADAGTAEQISDVAGVRENVVGLALSFVGGRYRAGGNDPHSGVDCSGFVKYVMQYGAGVTLNRSSASQAGQGVAISSSQMQPGDLIFYSNGSRINHVAMYIGNGQVVHASTYKTGIKTSPWNYRTPARIMNVLG